MRASIAAVKSRTTQEQQKAAPLCFSFSTDTGVHLRLDRLSLQQGLIEQLVELLFVLLSIDNPLSQVPQPEPSPRVVTAVTSIPWLHIKLPMKTFQGALDIGRPDVVLPAFLTEHSSEYRPAVHSNPHVHVCPGLLSDVPEVEFDLQGLPRLQKGLSVFTMVEITRQCCSLDVLLLLLGNRDAKNQGVNPAGYSGDEHDGCQPQRQSQKKGEAEESLPAHSVASLVEASIVQTQVAEYLSCYEHPQSVGHHPSRDAVWQQPETAQQIEDDVGRQSHRRH
ncbi:hypothetical protein EYF80_029743 [Liparis tanakae]|uniref:Uncharacterized protein n=1 Tax=Liparis tanakae TaxID=230148 RepID=A0A4Z2H5H0_9TELE|nr:hypothetical protein EYF80_029743 [Liparis tanakae]